MSDSTSAHPFSAAESQLAVAVRNQVQSVGTPVKLAPSASAFRKPGSLPAHKLGEAAQIGAFGSPGVQPSPSKGVLGQVSDLIFGW